MIRLRRVLVLGLFLLFASQSAQAARERLAAKGLEFSISVRQPEQLAAFYSARGFPQSAIDRITATCFLTVGIRNGSGDVAWLELGNWAFTDEAGRPVARITREEWESAWQRLDVPLASRATFGWTQLPERRDLQPDETIGGNVAVQAPSGAFALVARFRTGRAGTGKPIEVRADHLNCSVGGHP